ncbi:MAG TPA: Na+:solute symporter, partial [Propionibacteriaceae bacterium]|nr:Na+:solute symporter [Propionibacteriaceae bacterium]
LATHLLPAGLIGLVLAGMFSHTMAMTSSDANAISAVVIRDIIPFLRKGKGFLPPRSELLWSRLTTFLFIVLSMSIALEADSFGGVLGLLILWFGALVGPIAVPMLLGILPWFKKSGPSAAIISWAVGLVIFAVNKYVIPTQVAAMGTNASAFTVASPVIGSIIVFIVMGYIKPENTPESDAIVDALDEDTEEEVSVREFKVVS